MSMIRFMRLRTQPARLTQWLAPLGLCAMMALQPAQAQLLFDSDKTWVEAEVPPPPEYNARKLIRVEGPAASSLKFGVDPQTISIGPDYVVRYVVVMEGPAAITAVYEGIRCKSGEKRVYARRNGDSPWEMVTEEWRPLNQSSASHYALNMARDGVCIGVATNNSARDIVNDLRSPKGMLYR